MTIAFHPFANLFPLIEGAAFLELVEDVRTYGVREKIKLLDGMILDGRNRYRAAVAAGVLDADDGFRYGEGGSIKPPFTPYVAQIDGDPLAWVLSKNLHRRHLSDSQRAMVAAELATMPQGARTDLPPIEGGEPVTPAISQKHAAELMHTSVTSVERAAVVRAHGVEGLADRVKQGEMAVSVAEQIARLPVSEQLDVLRGANPKAFGRVARERRVELEASGDLRPVPRDARAVMSSRVEPADSLDYFPTPPWATRALVRHVLPALGESLIGMVVHEPACGEGHIAGVLQETALAVLSSDIWDYSYDGRSAPGWIGRADYLAENAPSVKAHWIISNPPFEDKAEGFVLRALREAEVGVAMFVRMTWLESVGRYAAIFRDFPPTVIAIFAERVPLHKGQWDPEGSTATAYVWLVWVKGMEPRAPFWIPPGQRVALTLADDIDRFTARPVKVLRVPVALSPDGRFHDPEDWEDEDLGEGAPIRIPGAMMLSGAPAGVSPEYGDVGVPSSGKSTPFKSTPETDAIIIRDYALGRALDEIAGEIGCLKGTLKKRAHDLGLTHKSRVKP